MSFALNYEYSTQSAFKEANTSSIECQYIKYLYSVYIKKHKYEITTSLDQLFPLYHSKEIKNCQFFFVF